jgi:DNA topoisomerase IA
VLSGKEAVIKDLKRAAKDAMSTGGEIWFATDLDREGEAIAWHLARRSSASSPDGQARDLRGDHQERDRPRVRATRTRSTSTA